MKKIISIILVCILVVASAFALSACSNKTATDKLLRRNWCENSFIETFTYNISTKDDLANVLGTLTTSVEQYEEGYLLKLNQNMNDGYTVAGSVYFKSSGSSSNYVPSWSTKTVNDGTKTYTQKVVYNSGKLDYYYEEGTTITENATKVTKSIGSPFYDNMQFYTILRGAEYNDDFNLSFKTFTPNDSQVLTISCSLAATGELTLNINSEEKTVKAQLIYFVNSSSNVNQGVSAYYATEDINVGGYKVKQALIKFLEGDLAYTLTTITATL